MGGFFGITSRQECMMDVFFGVDYHSHLGTRRGGVAAYDPQIGLQRVIHNIENSPFRTKFEHVLSDMKGVAGIGCRRCRSGRVLSHYLFAWSCGKR